MDKLLHTWRENKWWKSFVSESTVRDVFWFKGEMHLNFKIYELSFQMHFGNAMKYRFPWEHSYYNESLNFPIHWEIKVYSSLHFQKIEILEW